MGEAEPEAMASKLRLRQEVGACLVALGAGQDGVGMSVCVCVCTRVHMCVHASVHMHACVCVCMCVHVFCMCVCARACCCGGVAVPGSSKDPESDTIGGHSCLVPARGLSPMLLGGAPERGRDHAGCCPVLTPQGHLEAQRPLGREAQWSAGNWPFSALPMGPLCQPAT